MIVIGGPGSVEDVDLVVGWTGLGVGVEPAVFGDGEGGEENEGCDERNIVAWGMHWVYVNEVEGEFSMSIQWHFSCDSAATAIAKLALSLRLSLR